MPYLPAIIDKFLRRAGLTSGEKATLCDDLGAWHPGNTVHVSTITPTYYVASWGNSSTAQIGDPLRPFGNYGAIYPAPTAGTVNVVFLDYSTVYLYLTELSGGYMTVNVRGPGSININAENRKNLNLKVFADLTSSLNIFQALDFGPTLSTGSLEVIGGRINYLAAGVNSRFFHSVFHQSGAEFRHVNEFSGGGGSGGSGGSYTYLNYDVTVFGCTFYAGSIWGDALTAYTSTFISTGYDLASTSFNNCYN